MAGTPEHGHIFISYKRQEPDKSFTHRLADDLRAAGHTVWLDVAGIEGAEDWPREIQSALDGAYAFLLVMSPDAMASDWVLEELQYARDRLRGRIYPVMFREVEVPLGLRRIQHSDFRDETAYEAALARLLRDLPQPPRVSPGQPQEEAVVPQAPPEQGVAEVAGARPRLVRRSCLLRAGIALAGIAGLAAVFAFSALVVIPSANSIMQTKWGEDHRLLTLSGHNGTVFSLAWSPDGTRLASGSLDNRAIVWDASSGDPLHTLEGHSERIRSVAWSPDSERLATGSYDGTLMIWDATNGERLQTLVGENVDWVFDVAWSPDGTQVGSAGVGGWALWEAATDNVTVTYPEWFEGYSDVAWSPDLTRIALGASSGGGSTFDAATGDHLDGVGGWGGTVLSDVEWSPEGSRIASGLGNMNARGMFNSGSGSVHIWDAADYSRLGTLRPQKDDVLCVAWSPDGRHLASGAADGTVIVWDVVTEQELRTVLNPDKLAVYSLAWSPDRDRLAVGLADGTILVWDVSRL